MLEIILEGSERYLVTKDTEKPFTDIVKEYKKQRYNSVISELSEIVKELTEYDKSGKFKELEDTGIFENIKERDRIMDNLLVYGDVLYHEQRQNYEKRLVQIEKEIDSVDFNYIKEIRKNYFDIMDKNRIDLGISYTKSLFKELTFGFKLTEIVESLNKDISKMVNSVDESDFIKYLENNGFNLTNLSELTTTYI